MICTEPGCGIGIYTVDWGQAHGNLLQHLNNAHNLPGFISSYFCSVCSTRITETKISAYSCFSSGNHFTANFLNVNFSKCAGSAHFLTRGWKTSGTISHRFNVMLLKSINRVREILPSHLPLFFSLTPTQVFLPAICLKIQLPLTFLMILGPSSSLLPLLHWPKKMYYL